jgi:hypothetical protein
MCVHWAGERRRGQAWAGGLAVNGLGLLVTGSILAALTAIKFSEGGWVTALATSAVVGLAWAVRGHYARSVRRLRRLDAELVAVEQSPPALPRAEPGRGRTAVLLCNGYNGLGVSAFLGAFRLFPHTFDRCVFVHVGAVDAGSFKGAGEIDRLRQATEDHARRYADLCRRCGLEAGVKTAIGHDVMETIQGLVGEALREHPDAVVFAGQLTFLRETVWTRWLHNYIVFALQRVYCGLGVPFVIVPVRAG